MFFKIWWILILLIATCLNVLSAQNDTIPKKLDFSGDFRFRIEHDWNSRRPDGSYRADRSRLRYRFRLGVIYQLDSKYAFGGRLRSGNINDQQGPHVTIGGNNGEFGLVKIGLEKLFFKFKTKNFESWIGKNDLLFEKQNELFWNDNVFPEGISLRFKWRPDNFINAIHLNASHFIINSNGSTFLNDGYFELAQIVTKFWDKRITIFPGFYYFKNIGNIPDGQAEYKLDYSIFHLGSTLKLLKKPSLEVGFDFYKNLQDYQSNEGILSDMKDQKKGAVFSSKLGQLKKKGDWNVEFYYAYIQKYAIVDYFAQNDWVRWDYASFNAAGSRISNFDGFEIRVGYNIEAHLNLILRLYSVEQIVASGNYTENGDRIRLDLNIGF